MYGVSVALIAVLLVLWITWRWHHVSLFSRKGIPGPKPSLIFGNIIELYRKGPLKCHEEWVRKYGNVLGYFYGMKPILLVADPQLLKKIYITDFSKFVDREPFFPLADADSVDEEQPSVSKLRGERWKQVRSVLTPTFSTAKMKQMAITINSSIKVMLGVLEDRAEKGKTFDIHDTYQRLTMDVIAKTAFGAKLDIQTNMKSRLLQATKILFNISYDDYFIFIGLVFSCLRGLAAAAQFLFLQIRNHGVDPLAMLKKALKDVLLHRRSSTDIRKLDLLQLMIDTKIGNSKAKEINAQDLEVGKLKDENDEHKDNKKPVTQVMKNMTDEEIIASSVTVFLAGYETTSTALAFAAYLLGKHQDIQDKVYEEISELIQNGSKLEYETIHKLPYLDKVLNETLRLYPPAYLFTNRFALEDVTYGELNIPKGIIIQAPTYLLHHHPDYWHDPETFDPERFNDKQNVNGVTFFPFGIGPRNCLGMRFAQMEAKLALAHTVYNFRIYVRSDQKDTLPLSVRIRTLAPANGVKVKLEHRNKQ